MSESGHFTFVLISLLNKMALVNTLYIRKVEQYLRNTKKTFNMSLK